MKVYFDNNATTYPTDAVKDAITFFLKNTHANPSSIHTPGLLAAEIKNSAKEKIANILSVTPKSLIFNSGATEGNNQILNHFYQKHKKNTRIITTRTEHPSILHKAEELENQGAKIHYLDVNKDGLIDHNQLTKYISETKPHLVSIVAANSETGVIQDLNRIKRITKQHDTLLHIDASQLIGKTDYKDWSDFDYITFTGHKIHALQGIGVIINQSNSKLTPLCFGGLQENSTRPGTENMLGIISLMAALEDRFNCLSNNLNKMKQMRDHFENLLFDNIDDIVINGKNTNRVCNTSNITFKNIDGMALMAQLNNDDIYCSHTSACHSMLPEPSYILRAMGYSYEDAFSSLRFSFSIENTIKEVEYTADKIIEKVNRIRSFNEVA